MLNIEEITKAYSGEIILDKISFKVNKGDKCGLVGRNGSGKTTLLRMISKEEFPDQGDINFPKSYKIGYLTQHLHFTQKRLIDEAVLALSLEERNYIYKAEKILFGLGFKEEDLQADPRQFSGGYQLRIHLAKVFLAEPDCLLLDEPTNYLDIVSIRWFVRFLKAWKGEFILISHDRDFMDSVTTHTLGIHRKKIRKYEGGTEKFYSQIFQEEQIYERTRMNLEKKRMHMESFVTKLGAKASKASQAQSRKKMIGRMPILEELAKLYHLDFQFPYSPFQGIKLLETHNVSFAYENMNVPLIKNLNITLERKDRIAIIGKNGRGKSTILRLLVQELVPKEGSLHVANNVNMALFGQTNIERLRPNMTVEEEIASASASSMNISKVRGICGVMMFSGDKAKKQIGVLSGGERSRVLLGKILASPSNLLLLDEPTNHLDMESIEALMTALQEYEGAVVIVTHSEMILREIPTKFIVCHQGHQHLFVGSYDEFLEKEGWESDDSKQDIKSKKIDDDRVCKRKRAEMVTLRSKTLKPIQQEINRLEKEIEDLEKTLANDLEKLIIASQNGNGKEISDLSKRVDEKKQQIEHLYLALEASSKMYEEKKDSFNYLT